MLTMNPLFHAIIISILCLTFLEYSHGDSDEDNDDYLTEPSYIYCPYDRIYDGRVNRTGHIYSPKYGEDNYPSTLNCYYEVRIPGTWRVKITIKDMDIEPSYGCYQDKLVFYGEEENNVLGIYCGTDIPRALLSEKGDDIIRISFHSDHIGSGRGFHIFYETAPHFDECPEQYIICKNRNCVPENKKCDGVDDCKDGTDEEKCGFSLPTVECGNTPIIPDTVYSDLDRVVGGKEAIPGSWPWQVSLQTSDLMFSHTCGGSLINAQWILTAAHCCRRNPFPDGWRIHIGKHHKYQRDKYEQVRYVERIIIWPNLTGDNMHKGYVNRYHDIALMKLKAPIQFSKAVQPACLPSEGWELPIGSLCYATGWGETRGTGSNNALKQVEVSVMEKSNCDYYNVSQICVKNKAGFQSTCHGDSGGPLACRFGSKWYVFGGDSYGTLSNLMGGLCAMPERRTVFMKVSAKAEWIRKMVEKYS